MTAKIEYNALDEVFCGSSGLFALHKSSKIWHTYKADFEVWHQNLWNKTSFIGRWKIVLKYSSELDRVLKDPFSIIGYCGKKN